MLNTLWSADDISVKEELKEDVLTSPDSPFHCSPDQAPSSPLLRGLTEYHKLSPAPAPDSTQSHYYLTSVDSDNNHLGALLPAFHNLQPEPESPESRLAGAIVLPALGLTELSSLDSLKTRIGMIESCVCLSICLKPKFLPVYCLHPFKCISWSYMQYIRLHAFTCH